MTDSAASTRPLLTWLGQAGVIIEAGDTRLVIDPFLSPHPKRTLPVPDIALLDLARMAAVLCTHEHDDHLDPGSIRAVRASSPDAAIVVPAPLADEVCASFGGDVVGAVPGEPISIGDAVVTPVPAWHAVNTDEPIGDWATETSTARFLGYVVALGGEVLFHSGDTVRSPKMADILRDNGVTAALLPINGRDAQREAMNIVGNLTAAESADLAADAGATLLVPIHWDMFANNPGDPEEARAEAARRGLGCQVLRHYERVPLAPTR